METIFKVGDEVYDFEFGWGVVTVIAVCGFYPVKVKFKSITNPIYFTSDGKKEYAFGTPRLSFTQYNLTDGGFSQERPISYDDYIGKWGKFWDTAYENTVIIAKLSSYRLENPYRSFRCYTYGEDSDMGYTNFEPLTEEQSKILNLE